MQGLDTGTLRAIITRSLGHYSSCFGIRIYIYSLPHLLILICCN